MTPELRHVGPYPVPHVPVYVEGIEKPVGRVMSITSKIGLGDPVNIRVELHPGVEISLPDTYDVEVQP